MYNEALLYMKTELCELNNFIKFKSNYLDLNDISSNA